jgi:hypothetical protein
MAKTVSRKAPAETMSLEGLKALSEKPIPRKVRTLIAALYRECKGKSDLEIRQIIFAVENRIGDAFSNDGTCEALHKARLHAALQWIG